MHPLLARPEFRLYIAGQTLSVLGDSALFIALGIWAKVLTGSSSAAGLVMFCYAVPMLLLPLGGLFADRVRRRPLLVAVNLVLAVAVTPLLLVTGRGQLWIIYGTAVLYGLAGAVLTPAQSAMLRIILTDRQDFGAAVGFTQSMRAGTTLVAPLVGSGLYGWLGGRAVAVVDIAILLAAALAFLALRVAEPTPEPSGRRWRTEVLAGFQHLRTTTSLLPLLIATTATATVLSFLQPVLFSLIQHGLHRSPQFLGVLETVEAVGSLGGSVLGGLLIGKLGPRRTVMIGSAVFALGAALLLTPSVWVVAAGLLIAGAGMPAAVVGLATAAQSLTPPRLMGRTQAAVNLALTAPQAVAIGIGAGLVAALDFRTVLAAMLVGALLSAAFLIGKPEAAAEDDGAGTEAGADATAETENEATAEADGTTAEAADQDGDGDRPGAGGGDTAATADTAATGDAGNTAAPHLQRTT
ncbi:MFS transporter [Kitasatospora sp. NPDC001539]|uniref:MFS transporter n=1 Tax=Kitasatospora sp. NPDC001539 TaxID=3154384 RepID=UPI00331BB76C